MTLAQRELLGCAHAMVAALAQISPQQHKSITTARQRLQIAIVRAELESLHELPPIDVAKAAQDQLELTQELPALLRRQAE